MGFSFLAIAARAQTATTPGYPEQVIQWTVEAGETCGGLAETLYGSKRYIALLQRYNELVCRSDTKLKAGRTLIVPVAVVDLPAARVESLHPDVRTRAPGGAWLEAQTGMPLYRNYSVSTLEQARANLLFLDRTRIALNEHTLVVIYGSAADSSLASRTPPAIELESGELQAGLQSLRGSGANIQVAGGGAVTARSRDTVIRAAVGDTTVSVFDGDADVVSAGVSVAVPLNHGTKFVPKQPPRPPRPLPPAPIWVEPTSSGPVLQPEGGGALVANWAPVVDAKAYRVELARDPDFVQMVVREEAPATVRAFRGENLPAGVYYLRVRAIDHEDYLGVAVAPKEIELVTARFGLSGGSISSDQLTASRYELMQLGAPPGLEIALDDGPFGPAPETLDLLRLGPQKLRLRAAGSTVEQTYAIAYKPLESTILAPIEGAEPQRVNVRIAPIQTAEEAARVAPSLRVMSRDQSQGLMTLALTPGDSPGQWWTDLPSGADPATLILSDARGTALATVTLPPKAPPPPPPPPPDYRYAVGACAPVSGQGAGTAINWSAPTACETFAVSLAHSPRAGRDALQLAALASGQWGPVGFEARLASDDVRGDSELDDAAVLGMRWRAWEKQGWLSFGPALRLMIPATSESPPVRIETALALAIENGRWAWISNVGIRAPLRSDAQRKDAPEGQAFLASGLTWDLSNWLRGYGMVDAQLSRAEEANRLRIPFGVSAGVETLTPLFLSLGLRAAPHDRGTTERLTGRVALGIRGF